MLRLLIAIAVPICIFSSCTFYKYTNTFDSEDVKLDGDSFKFENNDLVISYDFSDGYLGFNIYNKTERPIFIDWKRSRIALNDSNFRYHQDDYDLSGVKDIYYRGEVVGRGLSLSIGESSIQISPSDEEIGYLRPKNDLTAKNVRIQVRLFNPGERQIRERIRNQDIESDTFNYSESPLTLGNTIFYSFDPSLQPARKVHNDFWIAKASMMYRNDFKRFYPGDKQSNRYVSNEDWLSPVPIVVVTALPAVALGIFLLSWN